MGCKGKSDTNGCHGPVEGAAFWGKTNPRRCSQELWADFRLAVFLFASCRGKKGMHLCVCFKLVCLFWVWEPWACSCVGRWHYRVRVRWAYVRGELNCLERGLWALGTGEEMRKDRRFGTVWANFMWKSKMHQVRLGGRMCIWGTEVMPLCTVKSSPLKARAERGTDGMILAGGR